MFYLIKYLAPLVNTFYLRSVRCAVESVGVTGSSQACYCENQPLRRGYNYWLGMLFYSALFGSVIFLMWVFGLKTTGQRWLCGLDLQVPDVSNLVGISCRYCRL
jgi:hypothetical protein